jgi:type II secretory pathway pseudopilin PulG
MTSPASAASSRRATAGGFTLVEVLLTIAILMVVITLSLAAINKARRTAAMNRVRADFQSLSVALEQYKSDYRKYPMRGLADSKAVLAQALAGPGDDDGEKGPGFRVVEGGKVRQPMYPPERTRFLPPQAAAKDGEWQVLDAYGYVGEPTFNVDDTYRYSGIVQYLPLRDVKVTFSSGVNPTPFLTAGANHFERSDIRPLPKPGLKTPENTFQYVLGDVNLNGKIDPGETLAPGGFILASPGADGVFTDLSATTDLDQRRRLMQTSDDIYQIVQ